MIQTECYSNICEEPDVEIICPLCGSPNAVEIIRCSSEDIFLQLEKILKVSFPESIKHAYSTLPFILLECCNCRLQFFQGLPGGDEAFYQVCAASSQYYSEKWEFDSVLSKSRLLCRGMEVLDIGCGSGKFLKMAGEVGMKATGLEFNLRLVEEDRKNKLDVLAMSAKELFENTDRRFDVVTCFHVLEHVKEPLLFMNEMACLLKKGGVIFVAVPFRNSLLNQMFEENPMDWPPHHLTRGDLPQLELLGQKAGLQKCYEEHDHYYNYMGYQIREALLRQIFRQSNTTLLWRLFDRGLSIVVNRYTGKIWLTLLPRSIMPIFHSVLFGFRKP